MYLIKYKRVDFLLVNECNNEFHLVGSVINFLLKSNICCIGIFCLFVKTQLGKTSEAKSMPRLIKEPFAEPYVYSKSKTTCALRAPADATVFASRRLSSCVFFLNYVFNITNDLDTTIVSGPRFIKIPKSYEFVAPIFQYRLNEFVYNHNLALHIILTRTSMPCLQYKAYDTQYDMLYTTC